MQPMREKPPELSKTGKKFKREASL